MDVPRERTSVPVRSFADGLVGGVASGSHRSARTREVSAIFLNIIHRLYRYIHYQFSDYTSEKINYYTLLVISVYVLVKSCAKVSTPDDDPRRP